MIRAAFFIEVTPEIAANPTAVAVCTRAAELEAGAHGYTIVGDVQITHAETGPGKVLVWNAVQNPT